MYVATRMTWRWLPSRSPLQYSTTFSSMLWSFAILCPMPYALMLDIVQHWRMWVSNGPFLSDSEMKVEQMRRQGAAPKYDVLDKLRVARRCDRAFSSWNSAIPRQIQPFCLQEIYLIDLMTTTWLFACICRRR
ncbi:hypothetical protein J3458_019968 [Metarhizium acridum]|uniref:uncharacterized protein n=1 Tax=Metarhizium acridum TaxID=92637 RepID=UPI001C6C0679|nr:hypothetical protein J3458_019968 [Metarhizium acridum]